MLLFIFSQASRRKSHPKRILHLACDVCGREYEKKYFAHIEKAEHHICSEKCQVTAQRKDGILDIKKRRVMLERYGADSPQRVTAFKAKTRETNMKLYGCEVSSCSDVVKAKAQQTNQERFGVDWHTQSKNFADKARATWRAKYGVDHPMQADEIKAKYDFVDVWQKAHETKKLNGTYTTSKAEEQFSEQLVRIFDEVERQVSVRHDRGTWLIDFKIGNVYIQFDGVYWHGLDRPITVISETGKVRDLSIVKRFETDREQDAWFTSRNINLVRITDVQARKLSDDELRMLLTS